jgi:hypothetical protein
MMGVPFVLCSPISSDEEMLGDKISFDGDSIHDHAPILLKTVRVKNMPQL